MRTGELPNVAVMKGGVKHDAHNSILNIDHRQIRSFTHSQAPS